MAEAKFEKDLEKLEQIVESLEEGGLSLDVSLKKFEEGIQLSQRCEKALSAAEKKIEKLTRRADGELETSELDPDDEEDEPAPKKGKSKSKKVVAEEDTDEDDDDELLF